MRKRRPFVNSLQIFLYFTQRSGFCGGICRIIDAKPYSSACRPAHRSARRKVSGGRYRLSKKSKSVAISGHVPMMATQTGKFCGKLCARRFAPSARFAVKFCRKGIPKRGNASDTSHRARVLPLLSMSSFSTCKGKIIPWSRSAPR